MATHILTWFSNKNEKKRKFIGAAYSQITCKSIHLSFIQYGLHFFTSVSLERHCMRHTELLGGSRPIPAVIRPSYSRDNHEKFDRPCSRGWTTPKNPKVSDPGSLGSVFLADEAGIWAWIYRWVILEPAMWERRVFQCAPLKCSWAHGNSSPSKMSEMYRWQFNFTPESTKTRGDLPVAVTAAQTITELGFWRRITLLPSTDAFLPQTRSFWWLTHC